MMGMPVVYIKDWLSEPMNGYALGKYIDNLVWCSRNLANDSVEIVYSDARTYIFQRTGVPGVVIALNNDIWNPQWTTVTCRTQHTPGTVMHDYTGQNGENCTVDANSNMTFGIPPAANGRGYGFWAPAGLDVGRITFPKLSCTQTFFGADDLDIGPATNGILTIGRVWIEERSPIESELTIDTEGWTAETSRVTFEIHEPQGNTLRGETATVADPQVRASSTARATGWHAIVLIATGLPSKGAPFAFKIEYSAPQTITPEEF
jgi:alpha-amylase